MLLIGKKQYEEYKKNNQILKREKRRKYKTYMKQEEATKND